MADGQQSPKRERDTEADGMKLGAIKRCASMQKSFIFIRTTAVSNGSERTRRHGRLKET